MNNQSEPDIRPVDQGSTRHRQALKGFVCGLACSLAVDAWVVRWALSGEFNAKIDLPSGYSLTVRQDREDRSENPRAKILIEFTRAGSTSGATNIAMRFV